VLVYPSGVDVSTSTLRYLSARLRARRRELCTRWRWLPAGRQALLVLAHLRCGNTYAQLAAGFDIGTTTTAYRYITEAAEVLAALAPALAEAMKTASSKAFVTLAGALLPIDRIAADRPFFPGNTARYERAGHHRCDRPAAVGVTGTAGSGLGRQGPTHAWNHRRPRGTRCGVLGRQGVPRCRRRQTAALLGPLGDALLRSAGRQLLAREDPRTRRAGHGHPQDLPVPAQTPLLHHAHHQPRPSHPQPAPDLLKLIDTVTGLRDPTSFPGLEEPARSQKRMTHGFSPQASSSKADSPAGKTGSPHAVHLTVRACHDLTMPAYGCPQVQDRQNRGSNVAANSSNGWLDEDELRIDDDAQIEEYELISTPNDFNVSTIFNFIDRGSVKIPVFQRNYVWDIRRASKLIESVILGLPVPQVFLYEEGMNRFLVIDGQQRLLTLYFFIKGRFPKKHGRAEFRRIFTGPPAEVDDFLANDDYFQPFKLSFAKFPDGRKNKFSGMTYEGLDEYKDAFEMKPLRNIIVKQVKPADDDSSIFEMFNRLNTGGSNLQAQEIRTSLYHSKFMESLFVMNESARWRELTGSAEADSRMKDIEVILRSFALAQNVDVYSGSMNGFLNRFCKTAQNMTNDQVQKALETWGWFLRLTEGLPNDAFHLTTSGRFSTLFFESVFAASVRLRNGSTNDPVLTNEKLQSIAAKLGDFAQEGATKTKNVKLRYEATVSVLSGGEA
jgi:hypothetical protein